MLIKINFPFKIVRTNYVDEQVAKTNAKNKDLFKSMEKMKRENQKIHDQIKRDIQFWSGVFGRFSKQECLHCKKEIVISPIGSGYYIEKDGVVHIHCLDEYLGRRQRIERSERNGEE
nr:MAG TPA: hypothetical protein [Caudoviricetes sp.]